jgi:hypothetical protein
MSVSATSITDRGISEANLLRRMRSTHALAKRLTTLKLFGADRSVVTAEDPPVVQVLLQMAKEFEEVPDQKLRVQLLTAMANLSSSLDAGDQKMFDQVLKAIIARDKKEGDSELSEAEMEKIANG